MYYEQYQVLPEKVNPALLPTTAQDKTRVYTLSLETSQQKSVVGKLILGYHTWGCNERTCYTTHSTFFTVPQLHFPVKSLSLVDQNGSVFNSLVNLIYGKSAVTGVKFLRCKNKVCNKPIVRSRCLGYNYLSFLNWVTFLSPWSLIKECWN